MKQTQVTGSGIIITLIALPVWIFLVAIVSQSPNFGRGMDGLLIPLFVLCGMTITIHRLMKDVRNAWPLSALLAGIVAVTAIFALVLWSIWR